jgi:hypothetical protein
MPAVAWPVPQTAQGLWNALFAPRYGPLLTQPPYPGQGLEPPGTCTYEELKPLRQVEGKTSTLPGGGQCQKQAILKNCPLAGQYALNAFTHIEARLRTMTICFNGGDELHWGIIQDLLKSLHRCICEMDRNNCPPVFAFPED